LNHNLELGIYVHWPFCEKKCPYCDFNSHVRDNINHSDWLKAYLNELRYYASQTPERFITSIFFGGGTPSLMKASVIETILNEIYSLWRCSKNIEITAEANPSSSEIKHFKGFQRAGINRLSVGVQSLRNQSLMFLGRLHSASNAITALENAVEIFPRVSFDLIYALPGQTIKMWKTELSEAIQLARGHVSLYQLTIEPGTEFYKNRIEGASETIGTKLYQITQEIMAEANLPAYEVSNHAKKGEESRHNLIYWTGGDYIGIGPGAHGRITETHQTDMMHNYRDPEKWLDLCLTNKFGCQKRKKLNDEQRRDELVLMGLRLVSGISLRQFKLLTNQNLLTILNTNKISTLKDRGYICLTSDVLKVTREGRQRLNSVIEYLLT
jgi:putative oxygen-independent coproporphyrinogen III oxidase